MTENPFLGVRLPPAIHQALLDYAAATGKTRSAIAIAALLSYLEMTVDNSDLTIVRQELSEVQQRLSAVEQALSDVKHMPRASTQNESTLQPLMVEAASTPTKEGLTAQQICEQYKISFSNLSRNAKGKGQSILEYLRDQTGQHWVQRGKRYYLPEAIVQTTPIE